MAAHPSEAGERFGAELRSALARAGITQVTLASTMGGLAQSTISTWIAGKAIPAPATVFRLERTIGVPGGALSRHLGYVPVDGLAVEVAVEADPHLSRMQRAELLQRYRAFVTS